MLNEYQQSKYNYFWEVINNHSNMFFDSRDRGVGKTYLINELGLELQALGYKVFIITPVDCLEYYAERKISLEPRDFEGRFTDNTVVLLDEVLVSERFLDFIDYCKYREIPVIGFIRYPILDIEPIDFKREYKCKWNN